MMPNQASPLALIAAAVALVVGACSADQSTEPSVADGRQIDGSATDPTSGPAPEPATAHAEIEYMTLTMNHHMGGVAMARLCLDKATHDDLRSLCQRSVETQTKQLHTLQAWLQHWYGISHTPHVLPDDHLHIDHLAGRTGTEFEVELMRVVTAHHTQIIQVSRHLLERMHHAHLRELAASIVTHETQDVAEMRSWFCHWYHVCDQAGVTGAVA
jgi:uncharacterized protein (DUF305 family)